MTYQLLSGLIHHKAESLGDRTALKIRDKHTKNWRPVSWKQFSGKIFQTAEAMCRWGVQEKEHVGIYAQNMAECFYVDFAAFSNRAITTPMYATSSVSQIQYIVEEAEIRLLFIGEQWQYNNAFQLLKSSNYLKQLVVIDPAVQLDPDDHSSCFFEDFIQSSENREEIKAEVANRMSRVSADDTVHLIYTSGTTGEPKGVMLTHANYHETWRIHDIRLNYLTKPFVSMCMLPLTHIFEKAWSFLCLYWGCTLAINLDPREIQDTIREVRPDTMCCVPRFWEKVYAGVQEKLAGYNFFMKKIVTSAIETGRVHNLEYRNKGKKAPWWMRTKFNFYNKTIFQILKKTVGIENGIIFPCAGAALSDSINVFMQSVNIPLIYGYGLTETTATVCCFPNVGFEMGTVGKVMPGVEVKIGENSEILVKGRTIMQGYYKKPEATARDLDANGWFHTGDSGYLTENNGIVLTERIKDLYKTANGKYVAPQQIEIRLAEDKFIDTAAVIGDRRKYVTALIIPDYEALKNYAAEKNIPYNDLTELCSNPTIYRMIEERINSLQQIFANYEQIKRFTLLPRPFSMETGELTNTLKMKRLFIAEKYEQEIEAMY